MPPSKSDAICPTPRRLGDDAVSEVVGYLITFGIIASVLVVAMLGFSDAQGRAEQRVADIQADSIAQRVAGVLVDAALFLEHQSCDPAQPLGSSCGGSTLSIALELPATLQGSGYVVRLVPGDCAGSTSKVRVTSSITEDKDQSLFEAARPMCATADARPPLCTPTTIGLAAGKANGGNLYVVYDGSCLGLSNSPV